ncbi:hypothetical protein, partial [uncultured Dialister sp.]|uniref:hypothetical protein n=1 Tax=uncultured Dialister sp. TaxID=278064 RepID=UPI0025F7238F
FYIMGGFLFSLWKITAKANTEPPDYPGVFFTQKYWPHQRPILPAPRIPHPEISDMAAGQHVPYRANPENRS